MFADDVTLATQIEKQNIPIQVRPKPISLNNVTFKVITKENLSEFLSQFNDSDMVFYAIDVKDYENLALNLGELRRFLNQQTDLIVYYETSLKK